MGKLKSMGKHVLGISAQRGGLGSIFIKACNEFIFLESVADRDARPPPPSTQASRKPRASMQEMIGALVETVLSDQEEDMMYASRS